MPTVSNTSPISNLAVIGKLDLLRDQFQEIVIPEAVARELRALSNPTAQASIQAAFKEGWLKVQTLGSLPLKMVLSATLHEGESEAIALAVEVGASCTLLDEREARAVAQRMNLTITGVLGVLLRAKKTGKIVLLKPVMKQLRQEANFFISPELESHLVKLAGE